MIEWLRVKLLQYRCEHDFNHVLDAPPQPMQTHMAQSLWRCEDCNKEEWRNYWRRTAPADGNQVDRTGG